MALPNYFNFKKYIGSSSPIFNIPKKNLQSRINAKGIAIFF